ncbi:MAG: Efflux ABC transporter, ATP-binding protein [uncultured Thermomicrobiales bacterium]|uniref:Efflux ABC transporter, ATP-binding protein n=1 Tax=uncultured Thermomicrobiales bacterium TaxID=1645740 RepID=A0A6J4VJ01_9BACT|nr:MAG: Efflux ABC transporter, ATP-binding protein [uncultured Thermomicrobiales bacterium]
MSSPARPTWTPRAAGSAAAPTVAATTEPVVHAHSQPLPGFLPGREPSVTVEHVSKWYGDVVAVSDVSFGVAPGVTGLLGPNGAGKSTLLKMIAGLLAPSAGKVQILGQAARGRPETYRRLGLVPEQEQLYPHLTAREFVRLNAILQKLPDVDAATDRAIATVEMTDAAGRRLGGFSKGMRQRIKVAAALVHDPDVLLMDEPLNGTDPIQRAGLIALIKRLGSAGKTILVSSHVLVEVERFAENIVVIVNGKLAAAGDYRAIRDKMDERDHAVNIRADQPRRLAAALIAEPSTRSVRLDGDSRLVAETNDARAFYRAVPLVARREGVRLLELQAADESLTAVFAYLVER